MANIPQIIHHAPFTQFITAVRAAGFTTGHIYGDNLYFDANIVPATSVQVGSMAASLLSQDIAARAAEAVAGSLRRSVYVQGN